MTETSFIKFSNYSNSTQGRAVTLHHRNRSSALFYHANLCSVSFRAGCLPMLPSAVQSEFSQTGMCIKPHSEEKSYCGIQCVQDLKKAEEVVSSISSLRCGKFERLEWKSHATIFRFTNNLTQGSIHAKCRKKRYSHRHTKKCIPTQMSL